MFSTCARRIFLALNRSQPLHSRTKWRSSTWKLSTSYLLSFKLLLRHIHIPTIQVEIGRLVPTNNTKKVGLIALKIDWYIKCLFNTGELEGRLDKTYIIKFMVGASRLPFHNMNFNLLWKIWNILEMQPLEIQREEQNVNKNKSHTQDIQTG